MRCVVIGAGVVGLAVSRALLRKGYEVLTLEAAHAIGTGTSSRNSEVIHAGIYYEPGSLKASCCVKGRRQLYEFCEKHNVPYSKCGKLVVATNESQEKILNTIYERAEANGLSNKMGDSLRFLSRNQATELEPDLECTAALYSPATGIIDSHSFMIALQGDIEHEGGAISLCTKVNDVEVTPKGTILVHTSGLDQAEYTLETDIVVNSSGLDAPHLAHRIHGSQTWLPVPKYAKGNYYALQGCRAPFTHLVYPVPEQAGLGVHITRDLGGQARFGPDVEWIDVASSDDINYTVDSARAESFYDEIRKYWPNLPDNSLSPDYSGVRPKLLDVRTNNIVYDFTILGPETHNIEGLVHLLGIESPGLTSSLEIANVVLERLGIGNNHC